MGRKILSVFMAIAVAVSLSACQAEDTGHTSSLSEAAVSEPSAQAEDAAQTEKDYSDYEEFPEGWSAERVLNMISIDGHQLSFPCTVDDILALSENFEIEEYEKNDSEKRALLYYKDILVALLYYNNNDIYFALFYGLSRNGGNLYLEGVNIQNSKEIADKFQMLAGDSSDFFDKRYIDDKMAVVLIYSEKNNSITLSWEEV